MHCPTRISQVAKVLRKYTTNPTTMTSTHQEWKYQGWKYQEWKYQE